MAIKVPVHSDNTALKIVGYGDYLASGAAYAIRDCVNTLGVTIRARTLVTVSSVSSDGLTILTAAHGTVKLLPWENFPFSFNTSLSGTSFNGYVVDFNTFLAKPANKYQQYGQDNKVSSKTF